MPCAVLTLRGFCVISSRLVDSRLSFMATYRCLPSSSGSRECRSPAARGSVKRRPFWISSVQKKASETKGFHYYYYYFKSSHIKSFWKCATVSGRNRNGTSTHKHNIETPNTCTKVCSRVYCMGLIIISSFHLH